MTRDLTCPQVPGAAGAALLDLGLEPGAAPRRGHQGLPGGGGRAQAAHSYCVEDCRVAVSFHSINF